MVVLSMQHIAEPPPSARRRMIAVQVETGGSGLARDRYNIERRGWVVNVRVFDVRIFDAAELFCRGFV
jgi:hypothetical protein